MMFDSYAWKLLEIFLLKQTIYPFRYRYLWGDIHADATYRWDRHGGPAFFGLNCLYPVLSFLSYLVFFAPLFFLSVLSVCLSFLCVLSCLSCFLSFVFLMSCAVSCVFFGLVCPCCLVCLAFLMIQSPVLCLAFFFMCMFFFLVLQILVARRWNRHATAVTSHAPYPE